MGIADPPIHALPTQKGPSASWVTRLAASRKFQSWAAGMPLLSRFARREGEEIFDLIQGFVKSQLLSALVATGILRSLLDGPQDLRAITRIASAKVGQTLREDRVALLLKAGIAMGLLAPRKGTLFRLTRRGAALLGVPGLEAMISHHAVFYQDMSDPVALLTGNVKTALADFWPYVFGGGDAEQASRYSDLMASSQTLVAEDTLRLVSFPARGRLIDVGGGTGAFARAVKAAKPNLSIAVFDLPEVLQNAPNLGRDIAQVAGSFRDDPLPKGADIITLVRVLYDHQNDTVLELLTKVRRALPPGGRLVISEPMSGGNRPDPITDVYFAFYTLAMETGRTRSPQEIADLCRMAGLLPKPIRRAPRPYVTSVVEAVRRD